MPEATATRPTLFIGSSSKPRSKDVAYAVQSNLAEYARVKIWDQDIFLLGKGSLSALLDELDEANFGLFVFGPDDFVIMNDRTVAVTRDNVVFELGLFMGRFGPERSFILKAAGEMHLPTDLAGITVANFEMPPDLRSLTANLGPACFKVRVAIEDALAKEPAVPDQNLSDLDFALSLVVPTPLQKHLLNLAGGKAKLYRGRGSLRSELRQLIDMGLLERQAGRRVGELESGKDYNLEEIVRLTDRGRSYVKRIPPPAAEAQSA